MGPEPRELYDALRTARDGIDEIIRDEGATVRWFDEGDRKDLGQRLLDLALRVPDKKLRELITYVHVTWEDARKAAPEQTYVRFVSEQPKPANAAKRRTQVADLAKHRDCAEMAIERLNLLQRRTPIAG
jgi:hypothetical protein